MALLFGGAYHETSWPRGKTHKVPYVVALTVAVRGAEQIRDNSPKQSPFPHRRIAHIIPRDSLGGHFGSWYIKARYIEATQIQCMYWKEAD